MDAQVMRNDGQGSASMGKSWGIDPCGCPPGNAATADDGSLRVEPEGIVLHGFPTEWAMCEPVASSPGIH